MKPLSLALVTALLAVAVPSLAEARGAVVANSAVVSSNAAVLSQGVIVSRPSGFFTTPIGPGTTFSNTVVTPFTTVIVTQPFAAQRFVVVPRSVFVQPLTVFTVPQGTVFTGNMIVPSPGTVFVTH